MDLKVVNDLCALPGVMGVRGLGGAFLVGVEGHGAGEVSFAFLTSICCMSKAVSISS